MYYYLKSYILHIFSWPSDKLLVYVFVSAKYILMKLKSVNEQKDTWLLTRADHVC